MSIESSVDAMLVKWGDRLFYPDNRMNESSTPRLRDQSVSQRANAIRARIEATVVRRAPQVMVKVSGGGRGMGAITAHFRYISKNGRLDIENELGERIKGKDALRDLAEEWRWGGSLIEEQGMRREAFNVMLSMPRGTDPLFVLQAAREFAQEELSDHKYVMVLHDHQANPHVHLSVRAESKSGRRLNPRKADLHRWREIFAEKLRAWGIEAEASRQVTRGERRPVRELWQQKAQAAGRLRRQPSSLVTRSDKSTRRSAEAWEKLRSLLGASASPEDRRLSKAIHRFQHTLPAGRWPSSIDGKNRENERSR